LASPSDEKSLSAATALTEIAFQEREAASKTSIAAYIPGKTNLEIWSYLGKYVSISKARGVV